MKTYVGTKTIMARPMNRQEYNDYRGWELRADEDGSDEGYLVEYVDGGQSNHPDHAGYISWSPADVFHRAYKGSGEMSFSQALEIIKAGGRVARSGWNGKNMFLFLVAGSKNLTVNREPLLSILGEGATFDYHAHIDMRTADGTIVPWLCSQTDMLANDWVIVEAKAKEVANV